MAKIKTTETGQDVFEFIEQFAESEQKKNDSFELIGIMKNLTGMEPYMWGASIIGFGTYHYKYASGHEGDAPIVGFSPRKAAISLYIYTGAEEQKHLLEGFGKYKMGKSCIYINKLADIDLHKLETMIRETVRYINERYPTAG